MTSEYSQQVPHDAGFRGFGLPQEQLPTFARGIAAEITTAWQAEYRRLKGDHLGIESYRRVVESVGPIADNVVTTAANLYLIGSISDREIGKGVLTHQSLVSVLTGVNQAESVYGDAPINQDELMDTGLEIATAHISAIQNPAEALSIQPTIQSDVFQRGEEMVAQTVRLPVEWVREGQHDAIRDFMVTFESDHGRQPVVGEIIVHFGFQPTDETTQTLELFLYGDEITGDITNPPVARLVEQSASVIEPGDIYEGGGANSIAAETVTHLLLANELKDTMNRHGLSPIERAVMDLRFGMDGRPRSIEEVGKELDISTEEVLLRETGALKKLKKMTSPEPRKTLKDYLE